MRVEKRIGSEETRVCFMYLHWQGGACLYTIPLSCVRDLTSPPVAIDISIPYEEKRERTPRGNGAA